MAQILAHACLQEYREGVRYRLANDGCLEPYDTAAEATHVTSEREWAERQLRRSRIEAARWDYIGHSQDLLS